LVGDFNGDGFADFVSRSPSIGGFWLHPNVATRGGPVPAIASDVNAPALVVWNDCTWKDCEILGHRFP
jgi:hypothetical protein